jgi:hypothetical protein
VRRALAEILVATGVWPSEISFELDDMNATIEILNKQRGGR